MDEFLRRGQFANYRLSYQIGSGGSARVYYGEDVLTGMEVAVKVLDANFSEAPEAAESFLREAEILSGWSHKHILKIYNAGFDDDVYFIVMEYIDGVDLAGVIEQYAREGELIPHDDVIQVGRAVALALGYAHQNGIIHRDVKPENVLMGRDGRVVLTDFGLAMGRMYATSSKVLGTAHYISPEQAHGERTETPRSDIYSLGVMLYEMLTGAVPFDDPSPVKIALQHINLSPPKPRKLNPHLSPATEAVLLKALEKNPGDRFETAEQLMISLEDALAFTLNALPSVARELPPPPAGMRVNMRKLSDKAMIEKVIGHIQSRPDLPQGERLSKDILERAIQRLSVNVSETEDGT